eukprot:m.24618 g.24618  ORF g.24618 m.24618 type:complete len:311 (+) comp8726_c0_seq1:446-1378(+)
MTALFASFVETVGLETMSDGKPAFVFEVVWSNGCSTTAKRKYGALYKFHCHLLDSHPIEAGYATQERVIPTFPGKRRLRSFALSRSTREVNARNIAEKRLPEIRAYMHTLVQHEYAKHELAALLSGEGAAESGERTSAASASMGSLSEGCSGVHRGFLLKLDEVMRKWKKSFYVLSSDGVLSAYDYETSMRPTDTLTILPDYKALSGEDSQSSTWSGAYPGNRCFVLATPLRTHCFVSPTAATAAQWLCALRHATAGTLALLQSPDPSSRHSSSASARSSLPGSPGTARIPFDDFGNCLDFEEVEETIAE